MGQCQMWAKGICALMLFRCGHVLIDSYTALHTTLMHIYFFSGHIRMLRMTALDKEEAKKKEKEFRKRKEEEEEIDRTTWCKYTLGLKHQVSKMCYQCHIYSKRQQKALATDDLSPKILAEEPCNIEF